MIQLAPHLRSRASERAAHHRLLGDPARLLIVEALVERPLLISDLVHLTGLHRNTVRAHLARLEAAGVVERERRDPIGRGRPATSYRLRATFAASGAEQRLLIGALVRLLAGAYDDRAEEHALHEGYLAGRQLATAHGPRSIQRALSDVVQILRDLAFSPALTQGRGVTRIALRNCPFAVSPDDPRGGIICAFHLGLIRGVVEGSGPPGSHDVRLLPHVEPSLCRTEIRFAEIG